MEAIKAEQAICQEALENDVGAHKAYVYECYNNIDHRTSDSERVLSILAFGTAKRFPRRWEYCVW